MFTIMLKLLTFYINVRKVNTDPLIIMYTNYILCFMYFNIIFYVLHDIDKNSESEEFKIIVLFKLKNNKFKNIQSSLTAKKYCFQRIFSQQITIKKN